MIVVADTSPLNYLIQIDCQSLLHTLYDRVLMPTAVLTELRDSNSPAVIKEWLLHLPEWVAVRSIAVAPDPTPRSWPRRTRSDSTLLGARRGPALD